MCGLKLFPVFPSIGPDFVTPHVGVWIETTSEELQPDEEQVTPHVGVWIETLIILP